ncbi:MAG: hypothetical protein ACRCYO_15820 [Bacteroidia bacterium]
MNPKIALAFGLGGAEIGIILIALLIGLIPAILYLLNLQQTMEQVHPNHRTMSPGSVWLIFIPLFGIIWNFIMIGHLGDSLANEYRRRNRPVDSERPGYSTGLWMAIMNIMGIIPLFGAIFGLVGLVLFIIYWVKMAGYKNDLKSAGHWSMVPDFNYHQQHMQNPYVQQQYQQNYGNPYQGGYNQQPQGNQNWQPPQNPYTGQNQQQAPPANNTNQWQPPQNPSTEQNLPNVPPANDHSQWQPPQAPPPPPAT